MISGIAQIYFNDIIGKKKSEIFELDNQLEVIAKKLSMEINKNKELNSLNDNLNSTLVNSAEEKKQLQSALKKNELLYKIIEQKNYSLTKNNENLLNELRKKNQDLKLSETQILNKEKKIIDNKRTIDDLNQNILQLRNQLQNLSAQLDEAEVKDKKNKVQIKSLGEKLNVALAGKVQELSEYQSIFLKKVKKIIGHRNDILVSGDRFIFPSKIFFKSASDKLEVEGNEELKKIAKGLIEISKMIPDEIDWVLRIDGHTDKRPISNNNFRSNWHLSSSRAIRIVNFLTNEGLPANRLIAAGFGEHHPLLKENTEVAFEKNRRIEIKLTNR